MRLRSQVSRRLWVDAKFLSLSAPPPNGRTLWLYLLTSEVQGPIPGLFRAGIGTVADGLGWSYGETEKLMRELERLGMIQLSESPPLLWLPNALDHNKPASPNVVTSWLKAYEELPEAPLREEAMRGIREKLPGASYLRAFDKAFAKALGDPSGKPFQSPGKTGERREALQSSDNTYRRVEEESRSDVEGGPLAEYLLQQIGTHSPQVAAKYQGRGSRRLRAWALDLGRLVRLDGASPSDVRLVIRWAHRDDEGGFWKSNLLSGGKVRKHFDQILIQARRSGAKPVRDSSSFGGWMDDHHLWLLRWRDEQEATGGELDSPSLLSGCREEGISPPPEPGKALRWLIARR